MRLLSAEQLLDSASLATGVPEKLFNLPAGDAGGPGARRRARAPVPEDFGQPARADACECERGTDSTLEQALQVVGGRTLHAKVIAQDNRIGKLLKAGADDATLVEQLFLATLHASRRAGARRWPCPSSPPGPTDRRRAAEDLLWTLLNHPEFLFQH